MLGADFCPVGVEKIAVEQCGGVLEGGDAFHLYNNIPFFDVSQALEQICALTPIVGAAEPWSVTESHVQ